MELTKLEEAIGTGRLMTQCPELDFKSHGYFANVLTKLEMRSPEPWLLVLVHTVSSREAACLGIWGAALWVTCSRLSSSGLTME